MNSKQKIRARVIFVFILAGAGFLALSLYSNQIMKGGYYTAKADAQYGKPAANVFDRGTIYFDSKDGVKVAAAKLGEGYLAYINPSQLTDAGQTYDALSQVIKLDKAAFSALANKKSEHYEEIANQFDKTTADSIKRLQLTGVYVVPETWRNYPGGKLAAHELGIIGEDSSSSSVTGRYGIESSYEDVLSRQSLGSSGSGFAQLFGNLGSSVFGGSNPKEGDIITTIDPTAQKYLEKVLADTAGTWKPGEIGGIIMDPNTGEIIAMSSLPTFDPNDTADISHVSVLTNPLVEHAYEMGSIMKPMTIAAGIDSGAITASSTYDDTGTLTLSGKKISNFDGVARGLTTIQTILSQSLNVGAATVALKVGKETFDRYFESFGLGQKTGIDLPNEATGIIKNLKTGRDVEIATIAYGQGISISPVNMARTLSILANGGYVVTPHLVKEIDYADGTVKMMTPQKDLKPN